MSAYRTRHDPGEGERQRLAGELARVREDRAHDRGEARALEAEERRLVRAIGALRRPSPRSSARDGVRRVGSLRVLSPCTEDWNAMVGDARVRHCSVCDRDVYDLAELTSAQVTAFLEARGLARGEERGPCVRMSTRADGTLVTADACPRPLRSRALPLAAAAAIATALVGGGALATVEAREARANPAQVPVTTHHERRDSVAVVMGEYGPPTDEDTETDDRDESHPRGERGHNPIVIRE